MKIRKHRKYKWLFIPHKTSNLKKHSYQFKYKSDMIKFLNKHFEESLGGKVWLEHKSFNCSITIREWFVWYNDYDLIEATLKIKLKQSDFRGKKFITKRPHISKKDKKYFAYSDKISSLMCNIYQDDEETILPTRAKKLINLFEKRGFKDFEPNQEEWNYINGNILDGISFSYWSDRCNFLRCKVILEYFKREGLLD